MEHLTSLSKRGVGALSSLSTFIELEIGPKVGGGRSFEGGHSFTRLCMYIYVHVQTSVTLGINCAYVQYRSHVR